MSDKVKVVIEIHNGFVYLKEDESLQRTHLEVEVRDYDHTGIEMEGIELDFQIDQEGKSYWGYRA